MTLRAMWRVGFRAGWLAAAAAGACSPLLAAAAEAPAAMPWYQQIAVNAFASSSYSYNFNRPPSRTNQFRVFDFDDNTFKLDVLELVVQKVAVKSGETGFRADLEAGSSVPRVSAAAGLFRDDAGRAGDLDLQQAFVTWVAPLGRGLRLDAGKFVTHFGYELIEGYDGYNDNVTHSFLFGYAIPFTHTGVRASGALSDNVSAMLALVNGWDDARDNNSAKSLGAQLTLAPVKPLTVVVNGMVGAEQPNDNHDLRSLLDLVAIWKLKESSTLGLNLDYGAEDNAVTRGQRASWGGMAAYLRLAIRDGRALILRAEQFDDPKGARTGIAQRLTEFTLTPECRVSPNLVLRGDLRVDASNHDVFDARHGITNRQPTVILNAAYSF